MISHPDRKPRHEDWAWDLPLVLYETSDDGFHSKRSSTVRFRSPQSGRGRHSLTPSKAFIGGSPQAEPPLQRELFPEDEPSVPASVRRLEERGKKTPLHTNVLTVATPLRARARTEANGFPQGVSASPSPAEFDNSVVVPLSAKAQVYQASNLIDYLDGSRYDGQIMGGKRHGKGSWTCAGTTFDGLWCFDVMHGQGTQTFPDGSTYKGNFREGKRDGSGVMVVVIEGRKLVYEGQFKNDLRHGQGNMILADGRSWDGDWVEGRRHGWGVTSNAAGKRRAGFWEDGVFVKWDTSNVDF